MRRIILSIFRVILVLRRKKVLLMWIGLEINLYCSLPLFLKNNFFDSNVLLYLFFKVLGSMIFVFRVVYRLKQIFLILSLYIKLRFFPFIFLIPFLVKKISWIAIFVVLVLKKIPRFYILHEIKCKFNKNKFFLLFMLVFFFRRFFLYCQTEVKGIIGWSSVIQTRVLLVLINDKIINFVVYFFFYRLITIIICLQGQKNKNNFFSGELTYQFKIIFFLLVFTGIPPFVVFLYKVIFFLTTNQVLFWTGLVILRIGFFLKFLAYFKILLKWVAQLQINKRKFISYRLIKNCFILLVTLSGVLWLWV